MLIAGVEISEAGWVSTEAEHRVYHVPPVPAGVTVPMLLAQECRYHPVCREAWCPYCVAYHHHDTRSGGRVAHCAHGSHSPYLGTGYLIIGPVVQDEIKRLRRASGLDK